MAVALFCAAVMGLLTIPGAAAQAANDYDGDNDGLIEVADLAQLNAIRWDLDGDGASDDSANEASYAAAYPDPATGMGCPNTGCIGYELTRNLDFSGSTWASDPGWEPLAEYIDADSIAFTATFDGNGYDITNLYINRPAALAVGLFGYADAGAGIRNVRLSSVNVTGHQWVGGLVGYNTGAISNSQATGDVTGMDAGTANGQIVGGLVGYNNGGIIEDSHHEAGIVSGNNQIGGLAGVNAGTIRDNSYSRSTVMGQQYVGGLVGYNYGGSISASYATGDVTGTSTDPSTDPSTSIGGLVGFNYGDISDSHASGPVSGEKSIGGLAGVNWGVTISNSHATGRVTGTGTSELIGGLVGYNNGTISNSYASGAVTGDREVGGLVGQNEDGAISTSHATGDVTGTDIETNACCIGGLVGDNHGDGTISDNSYATGAVTGHREVGGLVGYNTGAISTSHATGDVTGTETTFRSTQIGGLVGLNEDGTISSSYATGTVTGSQRSGAYTGEHAGGLVGANQGGAIDASLSTGAVIGSDNIGGLVGANINSRTSIGTISTSYATGSVTGTSKVGGLVGWNYAAIRASYSTATVRAADGSAGGLVGANHTDPYAPDPPSTGTISASYSTGTVTGTRDVGGLVGQNDGGTIDDSYWDTETSGVTTSAGGTGKTTEELQTPTDYTDSDPDTADIYANWNLDLDGDNSPDDPWEFGADSQYPALKIGVVADDNEPPEIASGSRTEFSFRENGTASLYTYRATDPELADITWSLSGADDGDFAIGENGTLSFASPPDFENPTDTSSDNVYNVTVVASDDRGNRDTLDIIVTVTDVNEGPAITGQASHTVSENFDDVLATYTATDPEDPSAIITRWSLSGSDAGDFTITDSGELSFRQVPDYDRPADSGRDNVYNFSVRASDGRHYGYLPVVVTVTDVNEPPTITTIGTSATVLRQDENRTSRLYTYRATDPERGAISWSVGGVDGRFFAIDERGQFAFSESTPPNFEQPGDLDRNNVYEVEIEAGDGVHTASLAVEVTVREVNEGPEVSGQQSLSFSENQTTARVLASYSATDPEDPSAVITRWSLSGSDGGDFTISENGQLSFRNVPDYDKPADSGRDNVYNFSVRASDGRHYGYLPVTVTVTDVNEPPTITTISSSATELGQNENRTSRLYTYRASDPEGGTITWTVGGVDGRFFAIDDRGQFAFSENTPPNFEQPGDTGGDNVYEVQIEAGDGVSSDSLAVTVTVREVNEGPEVSGTATYTIAENQGLSNAAYTATDPEGGNVARWTVGGRDGGDFFITQGGTLFLRSLPDYERPADSNRDNVYEVQIRPSDGRHYGAYDVTVTVTDVDEPPEIRSGSRTYFSQPENRTARLYTYSASDPERGTVTWSVAGTDGGHFTIDDRGQFAFNENNPPDFDAPGDVSDDNIYHVTVQARDAQFNTASLPVTVTVTPVDEAPVITRQGNAPGSVPENHAVTQVLARYTAADPERPSVPVTRWSTAGRDGGDFVINALGELRFRRSPDYERPADANRDNVYEVTIRASDGRYTGTLYEVQTVTVTDVDELPTITTTSRTAFSQPENRTSTLTTFRATDPEGGAVTWTATGADGSAFTMDARGALAFANAPDYERPDDANRDNVYLVTVQARDAASNPASLDVTVTVTDHNEGVEPTISTRRPPSTYRENDTRTVYTFRASDPQRRAIQWSLTGADFGDFAITRDSSGRGVLAFASPPNFEDPVDDDQDNAYELTVVATDDEGYMDMVAFTITVTDHNEGVEPTISTRRPPSTYRENDTRTVYTFRASDPQRGAIQWSLTGADFGDFAITRDSSGRGVLAFAEPPNFEDPADANQDNAYELTVVATDDDNYTDMVAFTITVTDLNEGPEIRLKGMASTSVPENHSDTEVLATYTATDPEDPTAGLFRWSTAGRDGGDFVINELGELRFRSAPDYERPADANRDNIYEVIVRASDGRSSGMLAEPLLVTVTAVNEAPVITTKSRNAFTVRENSTSVLYTYRATDQDRDDAITWSVGGTDGEDFAIYNGILTFRLLPDFEIPVDADEDNVYVITVVAADHAGLRDTVAAVITITDQSEGPVIAGSRTSVTVAENYDIAQALGFYTAADAKDNRPVFPRWSLSGRDGGDFVIDSVGGTLTFRQTPDYDRPADANRDNIYEVTVRAHDGVAYGNLNVTVTVTDVNEAPTITTTSTSATVLRQDENRTARLYTYRATDPEGGTITWSVGGVDGRFFAIDERGQFAFSTPPDFEQPGDAGGNNVYEVEIRASDGLTTGSLAVSVTVRAVNEGPEVTGPATFTIAENQSLTNAGYTARDPEGSPVTRWTVGGRDGGDFSISADGVLSFRNTPDYERPADANRDNVYEVQVRPYDGRHYGSFDVTVTVTDVNEPPTITTIGTSATELRQDENRTSRLYTYRATDPEGAPVTWTVGGVDRRYFAIDERGQFAFSTPPDFEQPGDSGGDNVYQVEIQASDGVNTGSLAVEVTVRAVDEGPEVSGTATFTISENTDLTNAVYAGFDPEGGTVTRWTVGGRDGGDFSISAGGVLSFRNTPDYERPADANRDNVYEMQVRPYDGRHYGSFDVTVTVEDVNEPPTITTVSTSATALRQDENRTSRLYTYRATDPEGETIIWTVGGVDRRFFAIDDRGRFAFSESTPPDFEQPGDAGGNNVYEVEIEASDGLNTGSLAVTVTVREVDEGPVVSGTTTFTISENQNLTGATFTGRDPEDPNAEVTNWRLAGSDAGDFTITDTSQQTGRNTAELTFRNIPDFDRPADSNRDNEYVVTIRAYNGSTYGSLDVTVTVTDQNEAEPVVSGRDGLRVSENYDRTLATYDARDMDRGTTFAWSVRGTDGREFAISDSGALTFARNPNYERPADADSDNVYEITIVASDGASEGSLSVSITVTDVNEGPEIAGQASRTVSENFDEVLATYTATDPEDAAAEITRWSVTGRDGGDFSITAAGELTFRKPPDVERPADANRDNEYEVTVRASDGRVTGTFDVTVVVEDVNEAPDFRSGSRTTFTYRENGASALYTYRATDPEQGELSWSLRGADAGDFVIGETGVLTFASPPDFDTPAGSGVDGNDYLVTVVVTDDGTYGSEGRLTGALLASTLDVTVTVSDVNEGPEIEETSANTAITVRENHNQVLATYTGTDPEDPDAEITRWSVTGRDGGDFSITAAGELTFRSPPDVERPADANRDNTYEVTVRASDGRYYGTLDVTVTVEAVDEAPEFRRGSQDAFAYKENDTSLIYTFRATDPEGSDVTWGISGTDLSAFTMSQTGVLAFNSPPDYERPTDADGNNVYELTVEASDVNGNPARLAVTVTVTNVTDLGTPSNLRVVRQVSGQLRVFWNAPDSGTPPTGYTVQWKKSGADWTDEEDVSEAPVTDTSHTIKGLTDGVEYTVRVIASTDDTESAPSKEATATPQETTPPTPASATVDGATLALAFNEALDSGEAPDKSAFAVAVDGRSRGVDAVAVSGSVVTITLVTAVFAGDAVTVDYTAPTDESVARLQDLAGNAAASVSGRKVSNTTHAADQMTATISAAPDSHDGDFTFEIRFSEAPHDGFSDKTMRDHAFSVTGGVVTKARRLAPPSNIGWEIHVTPDGDEAVTIALPVTTDCTAQGAICTGDRRPLSNRLEVTVPGPPSQQASQENTPATGAPTISGTAQVGETLTANPSGIADEDGLDAGTFSYQWLADDTAIPEATGSTYTLTDPEAGKAIKVRVSFTDDADNPESLTSAVTDVVAAASEANTPATGTPTINGTAQVGETLAADTLDIADEDGMDNASFTYQWLADDAEIAGAAGSTYTLADVDEGKTIKVQVSFTDDAGHAETVTSAVTDAVAAKPNSPATGQPAITGAFQVGETLTAATTGIADEDGMDAVTFTYQWLADGTAIQGATNADYTLVEADEGKSIKVQVRFTDNAGHDETLTSTATAAVTPAPTPNNPATGAPAITGTAQVGETLTANTSGISDADGLENVSFSYQWLADDAAIAGATGSTYTLADSDEGKTVRVQASFTDNEGNEETLTSAATAAVAGAQPTEPPAKPKGLSATASHDSVTLTWNDPGDDSITGYVILRRVRENDVGGEFSELVPDTGSTATTYTDDTVVAGITYTYRIKAINGAGTSERSRWFHIDIPAAP